MKSYFASPERKNANELSNDISELSNNSIIDDLMQAVSGLLAILNENRQIIALNDIFLEILNINDAHDILGLRVGEAINCTHAHDMPAGCGTSIHCQTCGAAIAIVSAQAQNHPVEKNCIVTIKENEIEKDLIFKVRASTIFIDSRQFTIILLQNTTLLHNLESLDRVFFHDIRNILSALLASCQMLSQKDPQEQKKLIERIQNMAIQISREIDVQQNLTKNTKFSVAKQSLFLGFIIQSIKDFFTDNPVAANQTLEINEDNIDCWIMTDNHLLVKIISNMVLNAFEAGEPGDTVKLFITPRESSITISVWNKKAISDHLQSRIFQRYFTTKKEEGHGIGTFSIKLFTEQILGGKVGFTSNEKDGTTFNITLPKA